MKVLIAGAGIGGLTLALALVRKGVTVEVYEQAPELGELGAGVQIAANGSKLLLDLGLGPALDTVVSPAEAKEVRLWNTGQTWPLFDLGQDSIDRFGAPYWMVHRGELHRVLYEAVLAQDTAMIQLNARATGVSQSAESTTLHFEGGEVTGDVLIGCDGVHSEIRSQLWGAGRPEFTGIMAWRGLAAMEDLPDELRRQVGTNWVGPGGHVITYPIMGGRMMNFVGLTENADWTSESWSEKGDKAEVNADFAQWHPLIHAMIDVLDQPYRWALALRQPLEKWGQGRVSLLGDACHSTLPFLAQGANMAIEDAVVLSNCLLSGPPDTALKRYEDLRVQRTTDVVTKSAANTGRFHNPILADPVEAVAYIEREWEPSKVRQRYDWLFEYDAREIGL